jgi:hypothetical protein
MHGTAKGQTTIRKEVEGVRSAQLRPDTPQPNLRFQADTSGIPTRRAARIGSQLSAPNPGDLTSKAARPIPSPRRNEEPTDRCRARAPHPRERETTASTREEEEAGPERLGEASPGTESAGSIRTGGDRRGEAGPEQTRGVEVVAMR